MGKEIKFINSKEMVAENFPMKVEPKSTKLKVEVSYSFKGKRETETYEADSLKDATPFRELYFKLNNCSKDWKEDYKEFVLEDSWDDANYWICKLELDFVEDDFLWNYIRWK